MRIAVLVISLCLTLIVGLQSCTIYAAGSLSGNGQAAAGQMGILVAFLFIIGGAFAMGMPRVSMFAFGLASFIGVGIGRSSQFSDLTIWGVVALGLAVMSYFGDRELQQSRGRK